jgi:hypothetical protein
MCMGISGPPYWKEDGCGCQSCRSAAVSTEGVCNPCAFDSWYSMSPLPLVESLFIETPFAARTKPIVPTICE